MLAAGCYAGPHEAGPTVICGQNLAGGDFDPNVYDATTGNTTVSVVQTGEVTFLRLTDSCDHGVVVSFRPSGAATILRRVKAADGQPVAVAMRVNRSSFALELRQSGQATRTVTFQPAKPD